MPTTLTLKNIPDDLYDHLRLAAKSHRRSLNSEAIVCLEMVLMQTRMPPAERLAHARALRSAAPHGEFHEGDIDALKRDGRP